MNGNGNSIQSENMWFASHLKLYFVYWNGIHNVITYFILIWEWKTCRSKFGIYFPLPNAIPVLRVYSCSKLNPFLNSVSCWITISWLHCWNIGAWTRIISPTLSQRINYSTWNSNLNLYSTWISKLTLVFNFEFQFQRE